MDTFTFPWRAGHSGVSKESRVYRCGGSTGLARKERHRFPVSPHARRHEAPETGRHL